MIERGIKGAQRQRFNDFLAEINEIFDAPDASNRVSEGPIRERLENDVQPVTDELTRPTTLELYQPIAQRAEENTINESATPATEEVTEPTTTIEKEGMTPTRSIEDPVPPQPPVEP